MPLPAPLSRANPRLSKKDFGHLLIIAGSPSMLGASALCSLAAMRSGAGLVTAAVPRGCQLTLQQKISPVIMTMPLAQNRHGRFAFKAFDELKKVWDRFDAIAIGPGIGRDDGTQRLVRQIITDCPKPVVIDADALFTLRGNCELLLKAKADRILTPHDGEMSALIGRSIPLLDRERSSLAGDFALKYRCVLVLKGMHTVVASNAGQVYVNHTGNVGMATAGSGDVLTGMITAFLGQGMNAFEAARNGVFYHGKAGDVAARLKGKASLIAVDLIDCILQGIK